MRSKIIGLLLLFFILSSVSTIKAQEKVSGDSIIQFAHKYLDTPYRRGGSNPTAFDCSGFSSFVYRHFGYELNRSSCDQVKNGTEVNKKELQPGDLVLFKGRNAKANRVGHVGIVVEADKNGNFKFIHASIKLGVTINEGEQPYYKSRFVTARRILKNDNQNGLQPKVTVPLFPLQGTPIKLPVPSLYSENQKGKIKPYQDSFILDRAL